MQTLFLMLCALIVGIVFTVILGGSTYMGQLAYNWYAVCRKMGYAFVGFATLSGTGAAVQSYRYDALLAESKHAPGDYDRLQREVRDLRIAQGKVAHELTLARSQPVAATVLHRHVPVLVDLQLESFMDFTDVGMCYADDDLIVSGYPWATCSFFRRSGWCKNFTCLGCEE